MAQRFRFLWHPLSIVAGVAEPRHTDLWTEEAVRAHPQWPGSARSSKTRRSIGTKTHRTRSEGM